MGEDKVIGIDKDRARDVDLAHEAGLGYEGIIREVDIAEKKVMLRSQGIQTATLSELETKIIERKEAETQSRRDFLTGLKNRRAFEEDFNNIVGGVRRSIRSDELRRKDESGYSADVREDVYGIAVVALDLNSLKEINDGWGHKAGDDSLKLVAGVLRGILRPGDQIYRLGGDEFVVVFRFADKETASKALYGDSGDEQSTGIIERVNTKLRSNISELGYDMAKIPDWGGTFAAGLSVRSYDQLKDQLKEREDGNLTIEELRMEMMREADDEMYKDKSRIQGW